MYRVNDPKVAVVVLRWSCAQRAAVEAAADGGMARHRPPGGRAVLDGLHGVGAPCEDDGCK